MTTPPTSPDRYARVAGSPGETPRLLGLFKVSWPFFLIFAVAGYLLGAVWPLPELRPLTLGMLFLALAGVTAFVVTHSRTRLEHFMSGARGEEGVAHILAFLPAPCRVFHGISARAIRSSPTVGDLDHVVVGPPGVFVVETKNWKGPVRIRDGEILYEGRVPDRPPLEQVKQGAADLRRHLHGEIGTEIHVQPVLCFASGSIPGGRTGAGGVIICNRHTVLDVIQEGGERALSKDLQRKVVMCLDQLMGSKE